MHTKINPNSSSRSILARIICLPLSAAALLLAACRTCQEPEQPLPDGTYTATIAAGDMINIGVPEDSICEVTGTFALTAAGENWSFFQTAASGCVVKHPSWSGTWKLCGDQAWFTSNGSSYTYQWAFNGAELRFTRVDDLDPVQIVYLTTYPWVLQK